MNIDFNRAIANPQAERMQNGPFPIVVLLNKFE